MGAETITQLPIGAALTGSETAPFVQSGVTVQISASQIATFSGGGTNPGTVSIVSGTNVNGFAWNITNPTTTPQLTLSTSVNGFLQGNGTSMAAASTVGTGTSLVVANTVTGTGSTAVLATAPTISNLSVTGAFTATGLVTNADLVNSSLTVAGHSVSLGGSTSIAAADLSNGVTGSGSIVLSTSPVLTTPSANNITLGTVSSVTGQLILANSASANTTTIQAGNAAAARTYTWPTNFGAAGSVLQDAAGNGTLSWGAGSAGAGTVTTVSVVTANGFAGTVANASTTPAITLTTSVTGILSGNGTAISAATTTGSGTVVLATSPTLVTPALGVATATSIAIGGATIGANALAVTGTVLLNNAITYGGVTLSNSVTGTGSMVLSAAPTITGHPTIEGVTSTGATGTGAFVFATSPTLVTPVLGAATGTSLTLGTVSSATGSLNLANSASAFLTTIQAGNAAAARTYTWPTNFGAAGTVLTDAAGNGVLSWTAGGGAGSGTVTSVSVVTANGFSGTVATASTTPAITLSTTITGVLQGNGTAISAATTTGTGSVVLATNPTIPVINKITLTPPATGATLTIADGTTLTTTANATISGTNTGDQTITLTGDVTGSGTGTFGTTIANNVVTNAKLRQSAGLSVIGNSSNLTGNVADITGTAGQVLTVNAAGTALTFGSLQPGGGGTGATTLTPHSVVVGNGINTVSQIGPGASGTLFAGQGAITDPLFTPTPVLGANALTFGTLSLANGSPSGAFVTLQNRATTTAYNFNLPSSPGTTGQVLLSGGGGSAPMTWGTGLTNISSPVIQGGTVVWNSTAGTVVVDGQGVINALAYGVSQTQTSANNKTNMNNALATGKVVYLPAGTYNFDLPLNITNSTSGIIGDNQRGTILTTSNTISDFITIPDATFGVYIGNLTVTRTSVATSGAGIKFNGTTTGNDFANIFNVRVFNHNVGLDLGAVTNAYISNTISVNNSGHGVKITAPSNTFPIQWQILNLFSEANGGDGFNITGLANINPCGQWRGLATNGNTGKGINITGCSAIRLSDSFFGGDGSHSVYIGTGGDANYDHLLTNVYTELTTGNGFFFDSGLAAGVKLNNCAAIRHTLSGLVNNSGKNVMINGGAFVGNGTSNTSGNTFGILNLASGSTMSVVGVRAPVTGSQTVGIQSNSGTAACTTVGCNATVSNSATLASNTGNY